jgi:iron complex transport system ATP-binding protein
MTRLEAERLTVAFGDTVALAEVTAFVGAGELVGLVGPNAAGKTTLVRALAGLLQPAEGTVTIHGRSLTSVGRRERARTIAYLPQAAQPHWPIAVERVVALGRHPRLGPWQQPTAADRAAVDQAMRAADVAYLGSRPASELSAGESARVMLARALASEPLLLLADEPVAQLDPYHQIRVMELFQARAAAGLGVLVVLHDLTLAARFCDRLLLLHQGRIEASGPPRAVLTPELLARVYGIVAEIGTRGGDIFVVPWQRVDPQTRGAAP